MKNLDAPHARKWTPSIVSSISNSSHVILMDFNRQSFEILKPRNVTNWIKEIYSCHSKRLFNCFIVKIIGFISVKKIVLRNRINLYKKNIHSNQ